MKLSDYIFGQLRDWGARHVFLVTGGGAMHLNDSIGTSGLSYVCTHHEQAAAMAAEGYARITRMPGVLNVTSGPGGINALNGECTSVPITQVLSGIGYKVWSSRSPGQQFTWAKPNNGNH